VASTPKTPAARSPSATKLPSGARRTSSSAETARPTASDQAGPEETHRLAELLVVLRGVGLLMDAIDRHARGPSAINSRQIDTTTHRTITSGTHTRAVIESDPGSSRADQTGR